MKKLTQPSYNLFINYNHAMSLVGGGSGEITRKPQNIITMIVVEVIKKPVWI